LSNMMDYWLSVQQFQSIIISTHVNTDNEIDIVARFTQIALFPGRDFLCEKDDIKGW